MDYIKKYFVWNTNPALYGFLNNKGCLLCKSSNWLYKIVESWGEPDDILTETGILKSSVIIDIFEVLCFFICWF